MLAEYISEHVELIENKNVLELAAGTGFTSLVAAVAAKSVLCTGKSTFVKLEYQSISGNRILLSFIKLFLSFDSLLE